MDKYLRITSSSTVIFVAGPNPQQRGKEGHLVLLPVCQLVLQNPLPKFTGTRLEII